MRTRAMKTSVWSSAHRLVCCTSIGAFLGCGDAVTSTSDAKASLIVLIRQATGAFHSSRSGDLADANEPVLPQRLDHRQRGHNRLQPIDARDRRGPILADARCKLLHLDEVGLLIAFQKKMDRFGGMDAVPI